MGECRFVGLGFCIEHRGVRATLCTHAAQELEARHAKDLTLWKESADSMKQAWHTACHQIADLESHLAQAEAEIREAHWFLTGKGEIGACMTGAVENPQTELGQAAKREVARLHRAEATVAGMREALKQAQRCICSDTIRDVVEDALSTDDDWIIVTLRAALDRLEGVK